MPVSLKPPAGSGQQHVGLRVERLRVPPPPHQRGQLRRVTGGIGGHDELLRLVGSPASSAARSGTTPRKSASFELVRSTLPTPCSRVRSSRCVQCKFASTSSSSSLVGTPSMADVSTLDRPARAVTSVTSMQPRRATSNHDLVLFGETSDLAQRLVLQAFYRLAQEYLPRRSAARQRRPRRPRAEDPRHVQHVLASSARSRRTRNGSLRRAGVLRQQRLHQRQPRRPAPTTSPRRASRWARTGSSSAPGVPPVERSRS